MAFTYGFYNSYEGDRKYNAENVNTLFDGIISEGALRNKYEAFRVVASGAAMSVVVRTGKAWMGGTWNFNDSELPLTVEASDVTLGRWDCVVLEINKQTNIRLNKIFILKGTVQTNPVKPTLVKQYDTNGNLLVGQWPIAWIWIPGNAQVVNQGMVTNVVGTAEFPYIAGIDATANVNLQGIFDNWNYQWYQQFMNGSGGNPTWDNTYANSAFRQFQAFMANIDAHLSGDVSTNILSMIYNIHRILGWIQSTGTGAAYSINPGIAISQYIDSSSLGTTPPTRFLICFHAANTVANPTLNVSSLGARTIYNSTAGGQFYIGQIKTGSVHEVIYQGGSFYMLDADIPDVVTQAEAEGGSVTTPRSWNALQVRNAANKSIGLINKTKRLVATFTSSSTFNASSYTDLYGNRLAVGSLVDVYLIGGGAGGAGGQRGSGTLNPTSGGAGGSGGQCSVYTNYPLPAASVSVTIGAGGAPGVFAYNAGGNPGGASSFGDLSSSLFGSAVVNNPIDPNSPLSGPLIIADAFTAGGIPGSISGSSPTAGGSGANGHLPLLSSTRYAGGGGAGGGGNTNNGAGASPGSGQSGGGSGGAGSSYGSAGGTGASGQSGTGGGGGGGGGGIANSTGQNQGSGGYGGSGRIMVYA